MKGFLWQILRWFYSVDFIDSPSTILFFSALFFLAAFLIATFVRIIREENNTQLKKETLKKRLIIAAVLLVLLLALALYSFFSTDNSSLVHLIYVWIISLFFGALLSFWPGVPMWVKIALPFVFLLTIHVTQKRGFSALEVIVDTFVMLVSLLPFCVILNFGDVFFIQHRPKTTTKKRKITAWLLYVFFCAEIFMVSNIIMAFAGWGNSGEYSFWSVTEVIIAYIGFFLFLFTALWPLLRLLQPRIQCLILLVLCSASTACFYLTGGFGEQRSRLGFSFASIFAEGWLQKDVAFFVIGTVFQLLWLFFAYLLLDRIYYGKPILETNEVNVPEPVLDVY